jgi:hypothetical protein
VSCYRFIDAEKANYPISALCRVLKVSRSGYYAWRDRPPSKRVRANAALTERIREIHHRSRETYGYLRVHAELRALGERCNRKRVARLMRKDGLRGCMRGRRRKHTTRQDPLAVPAPDLVERDFRATAPDRLWTADITYLPTDEGFLYLAFILDVYSRKVVGWSMATHLRSELVAAALEMAIRRRNPSTGLIHHSDRGAQGGFNRSKQHQPREVLSWDDHQAGPHGSQDGRPCVLRGLRGSAISASVSESSGMPSLRGSAARTPERVSASQVQSQRVGSAILAE